METMGKIWENMGKYWNMGWKMGWKWDGNGGWNKHVERLVSYLVVLFFDAELDGIPTVPATASHRLQGR